MMAMGKWWMTLTGPPSSMFGHVGGTAFFVLFVAILMILLFNMFVMIVISSAEAVKHQDIVGGIPQPFHLKMANCIADKLSWSRFQDDPYEQSNNKLFTEASTLVN